MAIDCNMDNETEVLFEDQLKINEFAKIHDKIEDLSDDIAECRNVLQNLSDAVDEVALLEDDKPVPFMVGDCFFLESVSEVEENLEKRKEEIKNNIDELKEQFQELNNRMSELKSELYAKFGTNINLEIK